MVRSRFALMREFRHRARRIPRPRAMGAAWTVGTRREAANAVRRDVSMVLQMSLMCDERASDRNKLGHFLNVLTERERGRMSPPPRRDKNQVLRLTLAERVTYFNTSSMTMTGMENQNTAFHSAILKAEIVNVFANDGMYMMKQ